MNITPEEAQSALDAIKQAKTQAHAIINFQAYFWLIWGAVWAIGFLVLQFESQLFVWIMSAMLIIGMTGSGIVGAWRGSSIRSTPGSQEAFLGTRYAFFASLLYVFALLWLIIFSLTPLQIGMLWITAFAFSVIISGIWFKAPGFIGLGIGMTLISVLGYYAFPHYFWLGAAVFAGLPLIGVSVYYLRQK